jgi:hypothetical protein
MAITIQDLVNAGHFGAAELPQFAITKGIAEGAEGNRVGVYGSSQSNAGVYGYSENFAGVFAITSAGTGLVASGGTLAADFLGDIRVSGDIKLTHADCAEEFDVFEGEGVDAGTVMVLGQEGTLLASSQPYDRRVAGVISGAGDYRPGLVLDKRPSSANRHPIALLGKVFCKVDAAYAPIEIGDLLTTSATRGHAMRATEPHKAFGALIGKALRAHATGRGLIPILVTLQ